MGSTLERARQAIHAAGGNVSADIFGYVVVAVAAFIAIGRLR